MPQQAKKNNRPLLYSTVLSLQRLRAARPSLDFALHEQSGMQPSDSACATLGHGCIEAYGPRRMAVELLDATLDQVPYLPPGHNLVGQLYNGTPRSTLTLTDTVVERLARDMTSSL